MSPWTAASRVQFWGPQHHTKLSQCILAVGLRRVNSTAEIRCFLAASCAHHAFASSIYVQQHKVRLQLWEWRLLGWFCGLWHPQIAAGELAPGMHMAKPARLTTHHQHPNAHKAQPQHNLNQREHTRRFPRPCSNTRNSTHWPSRRTPKAGIFVSALLARFG